LISDVKFLEAERLIDYSLLVLKVDYRGLKQKTYDRLVKCTRDQLWIVQSTEEEYIHYHVGIIDYLGVMGNFLSSPLLSGLEL
jgi:hypothetical protein